MRVAASDGSVVCANADGGERYRIGLRRNVEEQKQLEIIIASYHRFILGKFLIVKLGTYFK